MPWAGSLRVFVEQSRVKRKVLSISTMEGSNWHHSHVTIQPDGDWQVRQGRVLGAGGGDEGVCGGCQPQHVTLPRWCLRQWELGVTMDTLHWMTCMCQMEPVLSQVRPHPIGALWIRRGG